VNASAGPLPASARRLLERDIDNVEQLEVLLLLRRNADRYWDAEAAADRVGLAVPLVTTALDALARRGFLDIRVSDAIRYRFSPARQEQGEALDALASSWWTARAEIVEALTAKQQAIRDFSDAFRIRKDPGRG
jgi:DNA-binding MarR family transcriptional regulator